MYCYFLRCKNTHTSNIVIFSAGKIGPDSCDRIKSINFFFLWLCREHTIFPMSFE